MPKVEANGINIYYELMGKGDPLALIGGSLFGRQNFGMVWSGLAEHFQLISYDQRGYGLSDRPLQPYDMELWADDLASLLDKLGIEKTHVMGTSAGGMIALKFASKYPEKINKLILESASYGIESKEEREGRLSEDLKLCNLIETDFPTFIEKWESISLFSKQRDRNLEGFLNQQKERLSHDPKQLAKALKSFIIFFS